MASVATQTQPYVDKTQKKELQPSPLQVISLPDNARLGDAVQEAPLEDAAEDKQAGDYKPQFKQQDPLFLPKILDFGSEPVPQLPEHFERVQATQNPEKEMEAKLFDVLDLITDAKKFGELNAKNSNIGHVVEALKDQLIPKKREQPTVQKDIPELWVENYEAKKDLDDLQQVIRQSLNDEKQTKNRMLLKQEQANIQTSWYFQEMTKRKIDPDIGDVLHVEPWEREYNDSALDKNRFINFVRSIGQPYNYLEHLNQYAHTNEYKKNLGQINQLKEKLSTDLPATPLRSQAAAGSSHGKAHSALTQSSVNLPHFPQSSFARIASTNLLEMGKVMLDINNPLRQPEPSKQLQLARSVNKQPGAQPPKKATLGDVLTSHAVTASNKNIASFRYGIQITKDDLAQIIKQQAIPEVVFNFILNYINERHTRTTTPQARDLGFRRILFLPTDFFQILSQNDILAENIDYDHTAPFTRAQNIFTAFDYMFVPVCYGDEYAVAVADFNNKLLIYFGTLKKEDLGDVAGNPVLKKIFLFLTKEFDKWYSRSIAAKGWKFLYGMNTKTDQIRESPLLVLLFADFLTHGNFVFSGIPRTKVENMRNVIIQLIVKIGITKDHPADINDFTLMPM